jgi:hypothetical protein
LFLDRPIRMMENVSCCTRAVLKMINRLQSDCYGN